MVTTAPVWKPDEARVDFAAFKAFPRVLTDSRGRNDESMYHLPSLSPSLDTKPRKAPESFTIAPSRKQRR